MLYCTVVLQALLRRLEKRILVPLPDVQARRAMLGSLLGQRVAADVDLDGLAAATAGYSGDRELVIHLQNLLRASYACDAGLYIGARTMELAACMFLRPVACVLAL
jgi:hypothetical protein